MENSLHFVEKFVAEERQSEVYMIFGSLRPPPMFLLRVHDSLDEMVGIVFLGKGVCKFLGVYHFIFICRAPFFDTVNFVLNPADLGVGWYGTVEIYEDVLPGTLLEETKRHVFFDGDTKIQK